MLVYESDSDAVTDDYLLSQQLQDQAGKFGAPGMGKIN